MRGGAWGGKETINMKTNNQSFEMGNDLLPSPNRFEIIQNLKCFGVSGIILFTSIILGSPCIFLMALPAGSREKLLL